jgi:molybdopterin converting factor small subunit
MEIMVRIPSILRQYTELISEVRLEGETVGEVVENFKARFPEAGIRFFSAKTARYMNLYLNDKDIKNIGGMAASVQDGDIVSIVFAIAGG